MALTSLGQDSRGAHSLLFREVVSHPADFSRVPPVRLRNSPLLLLALCFGMGVLCRGWWQPAGCVVAVCALLLVAAAGARTFAPRIAWPALAVAFLALGWAAALLQPSREDTSIRRYADGLQRTLDAEVVTSGVLKGSPAEASDTDYAQDEEIRGDERELVIVRALRVENVTPDTATMVPMTGQVLLTLRSKDATREVPYLPCGAHMAVNVRLHAPQRYRNPGGWNYADLLDRDGVAAVALADVATLQVLPRHDIPLRCRLLEAKHWSSERIAGLANLSLTRRLPAFFRLSPADTGVLRAMLLGDRSDLDGTLRTAFERTGSFHLFVVAGVHISILTAALYFLMRRFRMPQMLSLALTISLGTSYAFLTGFGQPVQRALLMVIVYLVALALGRDRQIFNALGAALLFMLVGDPQALFEASLQMTTLSVIAVGGIAVPVLARTIGPCAAAMRHINDVDLDVLLRPHLAQMRVTLRMMGRLVTRPHRGRIRPLAQQAPAMLLRVVLIVLEAALLTLIAETVMALPMAVYFHRLTPFAAPVNLVALPLVGALLGCAMLTFLLALVHPLLAAAPLIATAILLHIVNGTVHVFSALRVADVRIPAPAAWSMVAAAVLWSFAVIGLRSVSGRSGRIGVLLVGVAFLFVLLPPKPRITHDALSFTAIDVGQGDALLVTTPDGKSMVIDAGGPNGAQRQSASSRFDVGEDVVSPFLWRQRLKTIDVLVITHAHSDHLGGALAVLRNFQPRELWLSVSSPALSPLVSEAVQRHIAVRYMHRGDTVSLGNVPVTVLSPAANYQSALVPSNDDSLVLRMQYGSSSVLAAGDAERASEALMTAEQTAPVTLLKVGHHGSNTSTNDAFLHQVHPRYAIISCGRENRFGHPRLQVLQRLADMHVITSRTDTMGAVTYLLHADGSVETHVLMSEP